MTLNYPKWFSRTRHSGFFFSRKTTGKRTTKWKQKVAQNGKNNSQPKTRSLTALQTNKGE